MLKHINRPQKFGDSVETKLELYRTLDQLHVWERKKSTPCLGDSLGLLCFLGHWKPAAFGGQHGLNQVSENVMQIVRKLKLRHHCTFQKDNDLSVLHTPPPRLLQWPQSPDFNPIKDLWWDLKKMAAAPYPNNIR